jgi:hypothetical protein
MHSRGRCGFNYPHLNGALLTFVNDSNDQQGPIWLLIAGGQGVATNPKNLAEAKLLLR